MKLKFKSSPKLMVILVGIFLIGTMIFNIFAAPLLQSSFSKQNLEIPKSNIIDYKMNPQVADALLQNGATIITFEYKLGCKNCIQQKYDLEYLANEYKNQIFLEEVVNESLDVSKIHVISAYSEEKLTDANSTGIFAALCNVMISPPPECAVRTITY